MIGILAYGSLIDDPGHEIGPLIVERIAGVTTPFSVEFARSSTSRGGAPTLIPVSDGGAPVTASVFVLREDLSEGDVADMLWRRETRRQGSYSRPAVPGENSVLVEKVVDFAGIETVLYTRIGCNLEDVHPTRLAELAISSARGEQGDERKDGVSYLINAKENGICTPLMPEYERFILKMTGALSLDEAWNSIRAEENA